jgi:hypothetical protein
MRKLGSLHQRGLKTRDLWDKFQPIEFIPRGAVPANSR